MNDIKTLFIENNDISPVAFFTIVNANNKTIFRGKFEEMPSNLRRLCVTEYKLGFLSYLNKYYQVFVKTP